MSEVTIIEDARKAADWLVEAMGSSGYWLDYSLFSLRNIDNFFDKYSQQGRAVDGGLLSQDLGARLFAIGSYVGEVMVRKGPSVWKADERDPESETGLTVVLPDGSECWPIQRVMKRFKNGPEDSIYTYGYVALERSGAKIPKSWSDARYDRFPGPFRFVPDSNKLFLCCNGRIECVDTLTKQTIFSIDGLAGFTYDLKLSKDHKALFVCGHGNGVNEARIYDIDSQQVKTRFTGHKDWVVSSTFNFDESRMFTSSRDGSFRLWEADSGAEIESHVMPANAHSYDLVSYTTENKVICCDTNRQTWIWNLDQLDCEPIDTAWCEALQWVDESSEILLVRTPDMMLNLFDLKQNKSIQRFEGDPQCYRHGHALSENYVAECTDVGEMFLWRLSDGKLLLQEVDFGHWGVAISPDESHVIGGTINGQGGGKIMTMEIPR